MVKRDLDEIEMELKGAEMLYVCDHVGVCDYQACVHRHSHSDHGNCGNHANYCNCKTGSKCIPVEPERVKGCVRPAYFSHCDYGKASAMCYTCGFWQPLPFPSPGLLQRMGMCVWACDAKDWCVFFQPALMTEAEAHDFASRYKSAKVFRWQDGVQG